MDEPYKPKNIDWKERIKMELIPSVERRENPSLIRVLVSLSLLFLAALLIIAPYLEPPGTIYLGNNGKANTIDHQAEINNLSNPVARAVYYFGDWECHQHADRSFFLHNNQMPVCARCTSIFLFIGLTAFFLVFFRIRMSFLLIVLLIVPMGLDGTIQLITPYESTNLIRFITGALAGFASVIAFDSIFNE